MASPSCREPLTRINPKTFPKRQRRLEVAIVEQYENELCLLRRGADARGGGRRGIISGFSNNSRVRMIGKINRLHWPSGPAYFCGLTLPDDFERDPARVKEHFFALRHRLTRRFPNIGVIWRQEWKTRKSGNSKGELAPHFHLFAFKTGVDEIEFWNFLRLAWSELVGAADYENHLVHGTDVKLVNERRHAQYYITKYMSKDEGNFINADGEYISSGRSWGYFGDLDFSAVHVYTFNLYQIAALRLLLARLLRQRGSKWVDRFLEKPVHLGYRLFGITPADFTSPETDDPELRSIFNHLKRLLTSNGPKFQQPINQNSMRLKSVVEFNFGV
ncbi:MAG: hypothetical protein ABI947_28770 [Chloroflexota bacterium]